MLWYIIVYHVTINIPYYISVFYRRPAGGAQCSSSSRCPLGSTSSRCTCRTSERGIGWQYLSNATCLIQASFVVSVFCRVKEHHNVPHSSARFKNTCVGQVVSDKWFPLREPALLLSRDAPHRTAQSNPVQARPKAPRPCSKIPVQPVRANLPTWPPCLGL